MKQQKILVVGSANTDMVIQTISSSSIRGNNFRWNFFYESGWKRG